jgi:hypothetical protein
MILLPIAAIEINRAIYPTTKPKVLSAFQVNTQQVIKNSR